MGFVICLLWGGAGQRGADLCPPDTRAHDCHHLLRTARHVRVLYLHGRERGSSWWHLRFLWSRFLSRSPVHQTQHVHASRMPMIRWCFAGKYSPTSGATACTNCDAGKFSAAVGASAAFACTDCGPGKYAPAGSLACSKCDAGTVSSSVGSALCAKCDPGSFSASAGHPYVHCVQRGRQARQAVPLRMSALTFLELLPRLRRLLLTEPPPRLRLHPPR